MNPLLKRIQGMKFEPTFGVEVPNRTVLIDGDGLCYEASTAVDLDAALLKLASKILEIKFMCGAEFVRVHLTPAGCYKNGRMELLGSKPYQGNRKSVAKPPLLELIRGAAPKGLAYLDKVVVLSHFDIEADDALMIEACTAMELKQDVVLYSPDKDLTIAPCPLYHIKTGVIQTLPEGDTFGWIKLQDKPKKIIGHGTKFFWAQMLMGDTADNVKGLETYEGKLCGVVKTFKLLADIKTEQECCNFVLTAYMDIGQNPLPEGAAMWLLRNPKDSFVAYVQSVGLTNPDLKQFMNNMWHSYWRI